MGSRTTRVKNTKIPCWFFWNGFHYPDRRQYSGSLSYDLGTPSLTIMRRKGYYSVTGDPRPVTSLSVAAYILHITLQNTTYRTKIVQPRGETKKGCRVQETELILGRTGKVGRVPQTL